MVITQEKSWKVKRIRNTPRVTIAECDRSGNPKGEAVEATATILDKSANGDDLRRDRQALRPDRQDLQLLLEAARRDEEERFDRTESGELNYMAPTFEDVYDEKYLLLTTFTKDGKPKPTTVWGVPEGDKLLIITDDGSWKTKRINNTPRVTIQKAGALGKVKGEPVEAVARILPKSETRRVFDKVIKRYWWHAWYFMPQAIVRGGIDKVHAAIEVTAPAPA